MALKWVQIRGKRLPVRGLIALLGAGMLLNTLSIDFTYANLNTYVISYLRQDHPDLTYADWTYMTTVKTLITGVAMPLIGQFSRKYGTRLSISIGATIYCLGIISTAFAVNVGLWLVVITLGVCHGLGNAFAYAQSLELAMKWFPDDVGYMPSFALACYGMGGAIWNPLETAFVNPDNVSPDDIEGDDKYFTDEDVLDRVPKLFLLLGGIYIAMDITAVVFCIRAPTKEEAEEINDEIGPNPTEEEKKAENRSYSVSPFNVLRTKEFYIMWYSLFSINLVSNFTSSFSKAFGQQSISDDHFLATVATISSVLNGACRIFWGKVFDIQGFQFSIFVLASLCAALETSFVSLPGIPTETGAKVFYCIWLCLLYSVFPGIYATIVPATMTTFGPEHYATNYGLIFTQNIFYAIFNQVVVRRILDIDNGYTILFFISAGFNMIVMGTVLFFPKRLNSNDFKERFSKAAEDETIDQVLKEE